MLLYNPLGCIFWDFRHAGLELHEKKKRRIWMNFIDIELNGILRCLTKKGNAAFHKICGQCFPLMKSSSICLSIIGFFRGSCLTQCNQINRGMWPTSKQIAHPVRPRIITDLVRHLQKTIGDVVFIIIIIIIIGILWKTRCLAASLLDP